MAQVVGYDENVTFSKGPFVVQALPLGRGFRLRVVMKGTRRLMFLDPSLHNIVPGIRSKTHDKGRAIKMADLLNGMVRQGKIVPQGNWWVAATKP